MRSTLFMGLFACVAVAAASNTVASAQATDDFSTKTFQGTPLRLNALAALAPKPEPKTEPATAVAPKPEPTVYVVTASDSLSSIAAQHNTDWRRIFNKNEQLANPDILTVGDKLVIPLSDEQLADRALPEPPAPVAPIQPAHNTAIVNNNVAASPAPATNYSRGGSSGNTYTYGYCTWYVKNMRPDLPNNLGNADTWVSRAAAQGIPTGSTPQVGAVGQQGMHVVYVERVNGDGTIFISEMNYQGWNVRSTRTVAASNFQYIY